MRVIVVNDFARVNGGAGKVAIDSALGLAAAGISTHFFAGSMTADPGMRDVPNLRVTALDRPAVNDLPARTKIVQGVWNSGIGRAFDDLLADYSPEDTIVHIHSLRDANTVAILRPIERRGFRWVFTAHDYMLACPYSGFYDRELEAVCTRKPMGLSCVTSRCNSGSRLARMWFLGRFLVQTGPGGMPRRMRHVISLGEFSRRILQPFFPSGTKVHRLLNAIDVERAPRVEAERNDEFVFLGRLSHEKDASTFALAAREAGVKAVFVGGGETEASVRGANPDAEITGWVSPADAKERLRRARALVFPSVWYEVLPMSVQEAIAMGVPVIASTASSAAGLVEEFACGETFAPRDAGELAERLRGASDARIETWSRSAYDRYWVAPRTMERHLEGLLAIYREILAEPLPA